MENFEDSRNALYADPNAYIQNYNKCDCANCNGQNRRQKIVFQEPYECMPSHHMNNDFKKGDCDCVNKPKYDKDKNDNSPMFDLQKILPLLSSLGNGNGIGDILKMLGGSGNGLSSILSNLGGGNGGLGSLLNGLDIFKLFNKKKPKKPEMKSTEVPIKNYTRVE